MRNTRPNDSLVAAVMLFVAAHCHAGEVLRFDSPHLVVERSGAQLRGHYGAAVPNFSCEFYFSGRLNDQQDGASIASYFTLGAYQDRERALDIGGELRVDADGNWTIKLEEEPPGCGGASGTFSFEPGGRSGNKFQQLSSESLQGIRVVIRRTVLRRAEKSSAHQLVLLKGDAVLVRRTASGQSYVEHQPNDGAPAVTGWIRTEDLGNPFP